MMYAVIFIFGRYAIAPLIISFAITNHIILPLTVLQSVLLLFCQLFSVLVSCAIVRMLIGRTWRSGLTAKHMGTRIFWGGFFCTDVNETDDVSGWCVFLISAGYL
ncbi:Uncharacterised protein [Raoultella ornithinolytica]|nr:Uncharacterised protein [Raoultella ornithinolytica]